MELREFGLEECARFGELLRNLRLSRDMTQGQLGEHMADKAHELFGDRIASISRSTINEYERGSRPPRPENALLLCAVFDVSKETLGLERLLTPEVISRTQDRIRRRTKLRTGGPFEASESPILLPSGTAGGTPSDFDWQRIAHVVRTTQPVDVRLLDDQWLLTRTFLTNVRTISPGIVLDLLLDHVVHLQQIRARAASDRVRRELGVMLIQTLVGAGHLLKGRADFGMAMKAFKSAEDVAVEIGEEALRIVCVTQLAQTYASPLGVELPRSLKKARAMVNEIAAFGADRFSTEFRVWFHASMSSMALWVGRADDADRSLDAARRAESLLEPGAETYFASVDPHYLMVHEGLVDLALRPAHAIALFGRVLAETDVQARPIRTWFLCCLANAYVQAGEIDLAGRALLDALTVTRAVGNSGLLEQSLVKISRKQLAAHASEPALAELKGLLSEEWEDE